MSFLIKVVIITLIVLLLVLFALSNVHPVPLNFILGGPVSVRAISLVLVSYALGVLSTVYVLIILKLRTKKNLRNKKENDTDEREGEDD